MIGVESSSENVSPSPNVNHIACALLDDHFIYTRKMLATELSVVLTKLTIRTHNTSAYRVLHPGSLNFEAEPLMVFYLQQESDTYNNSHT
jgi:hypothetical protein